MTFLRTLTAALLGFLLAVAVYHPHPAKAMTGIKLTRVKEGYNSYIEGDEIIGFSCASDGCYIATK